MRDCAIGPLKEIRFAIASEQFVLHDLHRRSSYVWEPDRVNLEAHPDALGVSLEAVLQQRVLVAVGQSGRLLGFAVVAGPGSGRCELEDLFVDPDFMRQGIGRALVSDAAARAFLAGAREMTAVSHPRNFAFYRSVGFALGEPVATRFGPATRLTRRLYR